MSSIQRPKVAYGLSQPYFNVSPIPIVVANDPKVSDFAEVGTEWVNSATNQVWVLTSVVNNQAVWTRVDNSNVNAGITWSIEPGVGPIALNPNYGYYLTNAAAVTLTLPAAAVLGSQIYITTADASAINAGFVINQHAGQYFLYDNATSTVGLAGGLSAINYFNKSIVMQIICTVANTEFTIFSSNIHANLF